MSPKRRLLFSSSSSGNNPPIPAPARQGRDGEGEEDNGDEVGSSNVLLGENVMPAHGGREEGSHDDSSDYESESDAASPEPTLQSKRGVPSSKLAKKPSPPKRKAVVAELAESSTAKKKAKSAAELVKPPPPKPPADLTKSPPAKKAKSPKKAAAAKQVAKSRPPKKAAAPAATAAEVAKLPEAKGAAADAPSGAENDHQAQRVLPYNAENLLEEKSERYWYLRQVVRSLEADHGHPGLFNAAFLKMDDAKATALNKKIIKQRLAECKVYNKRWDINKEIIGVMYNLMK